MPAENAGNTKRDSHHIRAFGLGYPSRVTVTLVARMIAASIQHFA